MTKAPTFSEMPVAGQLASLTNCLSEILGQYDLGEYQAESINHEFNSTFAVTSAGGERFALRINVNSTRSLENLRAEIFWVNTITALNTPTPRATRSGDDTTEEQLRAAGAAMAALHQSSTGLVFPEGAELPDFSDFFWGERDFLIGPSSVLPPKDRDQVAVARERIMFALSELGGVAAPQPIHADLHPWNLMWHEGTIAVFDFDDCGWGLPVQDLATALYYLDTAEQRSALLEGYSSVRELPSYTAEQLHLLLLQRRIQLLNYLYETGNPEHRDMIPEYHAETMRRIAETLSA